MFRLTRPCFESLLEVLSTRPEMEVRPDMFGGRERVGLEKTVLIALRYFAHQGNIRSISELFDVADSTVVICRNRVVAALMALKETYIKWPLDHRKQRHISNKFQEKRGFPGVIGAIDATHIQIQPPNEHPQAYVNRKSYHSIILQAVCLPDTSFSNCFIGWPGSVHDSRVLKNSELWAEGENVCGENHIVGDGAYPLNQWLLTPYRDNGNLNAEKKRYNYIHSSTRTVIERSFGILKGRFRRLHFIETKEMETSCDIGVSCCVLHNFCIQHGDIGEEFIEEDYGNCHAAAVQADNDNTGATKRDGIARNLR
ncbi:putative nuclease HARBI1 [Mytilus californianus]|uniref:putative nuclease HARBI1 n=1 Tax=Mytilus californianus TaxID=6549 RepID=UPI0022453147|nr:putative nuclease HARBI1 [Mytilus californianus]